MPNAVLTRLLAQREEQVSFIDQTLQRAETEGRDLVDAEVANVRAARERIQQIDAQRGPIEEFEQLRDVSAASAGLAAGGGAPATDPRPAGLTQPRPHEYRTAGEFIVDYLRARGVRPANGSPGCEPDEQARARVEAATGTSIEARAVQNVTTGDVAGIMPQPIVGQILTDLDGARPFVESIGAKDMGNIPGKTFTRPTITQHVDVGEQLTEKTELTSRKLIIGDVDFTKRTFGGVVDVSRQSIDWSSPGAWDAIIQDLQDVYADETDEAAATAFAAAITKTVEVAGTDLDALIDALYAAAADVAVDASGKARTGRMPDKVWTSLDMWAQIGAAIAKIRATVVPSLAGDTSVSSLTGTLLDLPRIMVPSFPDGTAIIGKSSKTEFYEQRIGLLSAVEPKLLGVEVAYGGYMASGTLDPTNFAKLVPDTTP